MANKLVTTNIVDQVSAAPISKRTLEHINSMSEVIGDALTLGLIQGYTAGDLIILYGCEVSVTSGSIPGTGTATLSAGAIYMDGEIYEVDANGSLSTTNPQTLIWVDDIEDDNATFTDGNTYAFHRKNKLKLEAGTAGTGYANYNESIVRYSYLLNSGSLTFSTGWSDGGGFKFRLLPYGDIELTFHVTISTGGNTTVGTIPTWARSAILKRYYVADYNGSDGASELCIIDISGSTITMNKQSDGTKPSNRDNFFTTLRYNIFS